MQGVLFRVTDWSLRSDADDVGSCFGDGLGVLGVAADQVFLLW